MLKTIPLYAESTWQEELSNLLTDPAELLDVLGLDATSAGFKAEAMNGFPLRIPRPYLARIRPADPTDPLLLQVLPQASELLESAQFSKDPVGDQQAVTSSGILQKYQSRVLLITTSSCAIHCRYCFRRHFPYQENRPSRKLWQKSLDTIRANPDICEVILSGGDPLATSNTYLTWLCRELSAIPHITRIRFHSRLPIMIPSRIDSALTSLFTELCSGGLQVVMVIHANHANEFDQHVDAACQRLQEAGVTLLNQSVLLRGINDSPHALSALSERMFAAGVLPYYLHVLDKVSGATHFEVPPGQIKTIMQGLQAQLPGYLVPRLVKEEEGMYAKTQVNINAL